ncbi:SMI1 / KNR4 family (SUKH-1) [Tenacibaculum sp. MAR_2009_124]|uniref:SMI1/KNR4 family protein n=1 Tax=Tenacibaculum sp. MAR_2009_124 TaxID=1250059 RepID=UPI000894C53A|nr:SMI1/KNR4 family protein [Tenacibaculum sp. MAR_2009_124]SEC37900.1 SMI1 / KNR4 family (SUKH-1) [Tenacibaculum sp. MAR_2009_124]
MKFKKREEKLISESEILNLELEYGISLPEDYKEKILEMNGFSSTVDLYFKPEEWDDEIEFFNVFSIKYGSSTFEKYNTKDCLNDYPEGKISIGRSRTGNFSMSVKKDDYGSIYVYYSDGEMHKLASSFSEFLEGLKEL